MHHNYFSNTDGRNPSLRFGAVHYYNNFLEDITDYGFAIRKRSHTLIENSHFHSVKKPIATDKFDDELVDQGFACLKDNVYSGTCSASDNSITKTDCAFWDSLPYDYIMQDVELVEETVKKYAGVGKLHLNPQILIHDTSSNPVNELVANNAFGITSIFPNPITDVATINFYLKQSDNVQICITDLTGRVVTNVMDARFMGGEHAVEVSRNELQPGIYLVTMKVHGIITSQRMIIR